MSCGSPWRNPLAVARLRRRKKPPVRPGDTVHLSGGLGRVLAVESGRVVVSPGVAGPGGSWRPYAPAMVVAVKTLRRGHWTRAEQTRIAGLRAARLTWSEIAAATGRSAKVCQYLYRLWRAQC